MNEIIKFHEEDMKQLFFETVCWCHRTKRSGIPLCPSCFSKLHHPVDSNLKNSLELIRHNGKKCWSQMIEVYTQAVECLDDTAA